MLKEFNLVATKAKIVKTGDKFGRLTVIAVGQIPNTYRYMSVCLCECGSDLKSIRSDGLISGSVESCGCLQKERTAKHNLTSSIHYSRWRNMMARCYNESSASYKDYGGRGIKVCQWWHNLSNFVNDVPEGHFNGAEIDRVNNDGDYEPNNVRWATKAIQTRNRRSNVNIQFNGKTQCLTDWANEIGICLESLRVRIKRWGVEKALTTPKGKRLYDRWSSHIKSPERLAQLAKPRRILKTVNYNGKIYNIANLSRECGISIKLLNKRLFEHNWTVNKAVETKLLSRHKCDNSTITTNHKEEA